MSRAKNCEDSESFEGLYLIKK